MNCPSCGIENQFGANFCINCGTPLDVKENTIGCIKDGKWYRGPNEVVRLVDQNQLKKAFSFFGSLSSKSLEVPLGSICAVVENGIVVDVLPPGRQTTKKWFEDFLAQFEQSNTVGQLYLISRQSIGFPISLTTNTEHAQGQAQESVRILVTGNVGHTFSNPERITKFLTHFVQEKEFLTLTDIQQQLQPHIESLVQERNKVTSSRSELVRSLTSRLNNDFLSQTGLQFHVRVTPEGFTQTIGFHFGLVNVPSTEKCRSCRKEVQWGSRFCIHCKTPNLMRPPTSTKAEELALITQDGQHIELNTTFSLSGAKPLYSCEAFARPLAERLARVVRDMSFESLTTKKGLADIEAVIQETLEQLLVGYEILRCTVLDLRSKKEGWLFKTQADMEQVRLELNATKQWLAVGAQEQDMEREVHEFIAARTQVERELSLVALSAELEYKRSRGSLQQDNREIEANLQLSAAEASFVLAQRRANLEEKRAELKASTDLKDKERVHAINEELALLAHESRVTAFSNQTLYNRMVQRAKQEEEKIQTEFAQKQEKSNLAHTQDVASSQAQHNIDMGSRTGAHHRSERIANAQTQSQIEELQQQTEMSGLRARNELKQQQEEAKLAREIKKREQERIDTQQKADIAKDLQSSKQQHELNVMEARQRLMESLKGESVGSIMALAAVGAGRALTDAESVAISKIESGADEVRANLLANFIEQNGAEKQKLLEFFSEIVSNQANATAHAAAGIKLQEKNKQMTSAAAEVAKGTSNTACPACNTSNPAGAKFCQTCGHDF